MERARACRRARARPGAETGASLRVRVPHSGDWLMGLAWCLCCGAISPLAYFYAAYFLVLLVHRAMRDDHFCSEKYGADWKAYKQKVPAIFIPGVI